MRIKNNLLKVIVCFLLLATTALAQNGVNERLKEKYKVVDGQFYLVRPEVAIGLNTSQKDEIIQIKFKSQTTQTSEISKLTLATIRDIVDEVIPIAQRGDYLDNSVDTDEITVKYQHLSIKIMFDGSQDKNNLKNATAYFLWKN